MSHRALVVVHRDDGHLDVYESSDGAADDVLERLMTSDPNSVRRLLTGPPIARARSCETVLTTYLDPIGHEAVVVVHRDGQVTPHVVVPYVLATADGLIESETPGAVLSLTGSDGTVLRPAYVRGWVHGAVDVLGEAVDGAVLSPDEAIEWLANGVERLAGGRHELVEIPTPR